jgi:3-(3-hydroxy-phenyl)propionate hydroxylase
VMSPFGARGLNSGVADAENLAWKLAAVAAGRAADGLLDTYEAERRPAAVANLAATDATMRFLAPHGAIRRAWRDLVLRGAPHVAWLRRRVDSGRLAAPARYAANGPDDASLPRHGSVAPDLALPDGERLWERLGAGLVVVAPEPVDGPVRAVAVGRGTAYGDRAWLVRPDGYLAGSASAADAGAWLPGAVERLMAGRSA